MATNLKNPRTRRLVTAGLLLVCAVILAHTVLTLTGVWGGPSSTSASSTANVPPAAPSVSGRSVPAPSAQSKGGGNEAVLRLDELEELNGRPLPDFERNPFEYGPTPEEVRRAQEAKNNPPSPPPPPPPPPVPFKAMGYQQEAGGQRIAYLCSGDCTTADQDTYMVHEGQEFGQHFKVLKISDSMVEVEDESYHQTVQLPFPE